MQFPTSFIYIYIYIENPFQVLLKYKSWCYNIISINLFHHFHFGRSSRNLFVGSLSISWNSVEETVSSISDPCVSLIELSLIVSLNFEYAFMFPPQLVWPTGDQIHHTWLAFYSSGISICHVLPSPTSRISLWSENLGNSWIWNFWKFWGANV